ncbi:MAG TPA: 3-oxoacyl-ACP reductase family protein [Methylomirabilota bacterium]|nr:3-oxoacyl-ACP reductase family protein [Methylomirabilota bacterium]
MNLTGKVALVTGGAKRVGKAIVQTLAGRGCKMIVHYHTSQAAAEETVQELTAAGGEALALQADITQEEAVDRMIAAAVAHFGRIDILVNNAAIFFRTPIDTLTVEEWERTLEVNLTGTFLCAQKIGLRMKAWGWGHIINIADVAGRRPWADYIPYSVSKACVITLTQGLALELAPEVMVNAIVPGPVLFDADTPPEVQQREIAKTLLKRAGTPEEVAEVVTFVAESDYSTGALFHVDGGRELT